MSFRSDCASSGCVPEAHRNEKLKEVEKLVTFPIETAVNGATHVRWSDLNPQRYLYLVWIEFRWNTTFFKARQIVNEKIIAVAEHLPVKVGNPTIGATCPSIMGWNHTHQFDSRLHLTNGIAGLLRLVPPPKALGHRRCSTIIVIGGEYKQYQILASSQKNTFNISLSDLVKACEEANGNSSGGFMNEYGNEYIGVA